MTQHANFHHPSNGAVTDQCLSSFLSNPLMSTACYSFFNTSKYAVWYANIIFKAKKRWQDRPKDLTIEEHHIIPKSLGGQNVKWNYVYLTPREHFICHKLLEKAVQTKAQANKMKLALRWMIRRDGFKEHVRFSSKLYEELRDAHRLVKLDHWANPENKQLQSQRLKKVDAKKTDAYRQAEQEWLLKASHDYWSTVTAEEKQRIYSLRKKTAHNRGLVSYFNPDDYTLKGLYELNKQPEGWVRGDPALWKNGKPSARSIARWSKQASSQSADKALCYEIASNTEDAEILGKGHYI